MRLALPGAALACGPIWCQRADVMKRVLVFIGVFVLVMLAAVNAALLMPPTAFVRPLLVDGVRHATGLDLKIGGPIGLRLFPALSLRIEDVVVSNPAATASRASGAALLQARVVEVRTSLWPLINGERNIERVRLIEPRITLSIGKDGRPDWVGPAAIPQSNPPAGSRPAASVASIAISGGTIEFRDARDGLMASLTNVEASANGIATSGFAAATIGNADGTVVIERDGSKVTFAGLTGSAVLLQGDRLGELKLTGKSVAWGNETSRSGFTAEQAAASARNLSLQSAGTIAVSSGNVRWRDEGRGNTVAGRDVTLTATEFAGGRLKTALLKGGSVSWREDGAAVGGAAAGGAQAAATKLDIEQLAVAAPVVALGEPIEADVALVWNKERIAGRTRLPAPDALALGAALGTALGPAIPAVLSLATAKGSLEFDGDVTMGAAPRVKGRTKATTPALEALSRWLGVALPPSVVGAASLDGDIDAQFGGASAAGQPSARRRIAMTNGRIEHDDAVATGSLTVDLSGVRPLISGKLASDKVDANRYLGLAAPAQSATQAPTQAGGPVRRVAAPPVVRTAPAVPVKEALKAYMRAMLEAPSNGGTITTDVSLEELTQGSRRTRAPAAGQATTEAEWSDVSLNLSALRTVDLDLEIAVKSLEIHNFDITVPRLKAVLKDGALVLEGQDLATRDRATRGARFAGKLSGRANIDARQSIPHVATSFTASGVDVYDLMQSIGVTALIAGSSDVEVDLTGNGASQKQLVETLSGRVKARVGQGEIVGYDFSSVLSWLFGDRTFDPSQRTPFTRLDAAVSFDNGVARDSTVELTGPIIGGDADGTIKLPEKEIDYRARFKLSSFFSALSLRIFGEWDKPSVTPDLDVFSRSPTGQMSPAEMLAGSDLADAELAGLIGRVLDRAGAGGLPPAVSDVLRGLKSRAEATRP